MEYRRGELEGKGQRVPKKLEIRFFLSVARYVRGRILSRQLKYSE